MKLHVYSKTKIFSNNISLKAYQKLTGEMLLLPYYHAVTNDPKPHIKNLGYYRTKDEFVQDLSYLTENYFSIPVHDLVKKSEKPVFHLSFDDGLAEVYTDVLPLLIEKKIHATFFINSDFLDNKDLFYRHKIGVIIEFLQNGNNIERVGSLLQISPKEVISYLHSLKFADTPLIDSIAQELGVDFKQYLKDNKPYLTTNQVKELIQSGFTIGNHGKSHLNFNSIPFDEQKEQIVHTNKLLKDVFALEKFYFSFPFGDEKIKNEFFDFMYDKGAIDLSFGTSGIKHDEHEKHLHRIPMEHLGYSAENIIKYEYFYFILKSFFNRNVIKRNA